MVYSSSDSFTFFWRPHEENGFLGQWFESPFEVDGERYMNAEQFMMAEKARSKIRRKSLYFQSSVLINLVLITPFVRIYRVGHLVGKWVGMILICYVPPSCPAARPVLPISYQPKQNQADSGTAKIKFNPAQLSDQMFLPVQC